MAKKKLKDLPRASGQIRTLGQYPLSKRPPGPSLRQSHPALALELIDKGPYTADDLVAGSNRVVLWRHGRCGQEIWVSVSVRCRAWDEGSAFQACYKCAGRQEPLQRQAQVIPKWLQKQCIPDKKRLTKIKDISPWSQTYWQYNCPKGSGKVFSSRIVDRVNPEDETEKQGCPCARCYTGERRNIYTQSQTSFDLKAMYLTTGENLGFDPKRLPLTSRVRWRCDKDSSHLFSRSLLELEEKGCPKCRTVEKDSLAAEKYRHIVREFLFVRRFPDLSPSAIKPGSHLVAAFRCSAGHTYEKAIYRRTQKNKPEGCPYCAGKRSDAPTLFSLFPYLLKRWHPEKNVVMDKVSGEMVEIEPDTVLADSRKKYWFTCPSGHSYQASPKEITENADQCQKCAILPNCVDNVRPELTEQWDSKKNGELTPWNTAAGSSTLVSWRCKAGPDHQWQAKVYKRALEKNGCPYCANRRLSITNTLEAKYPELAKLMLPEDNGGLEASEVIASMSSAFNWRCGCSRTYRRLLRHMVESGTGCNECRAQKGHSS